MNIIFQVNGGIGKSIAATAVCRAIREKYRVCNLIVVTGYPDVFLYNPHVDRVVDFNQLSYFYKDFIEDKEVLYMVQDPYQHNAFLRQECHLIEAWLEMYDLPDVEPVPEIYLTEREIDFYKKRFESDKPLLVMQTNGGLPDQPNAYSWARDIPNYVADAVVERFKDEYTIAHLRRPDQRDIAGAVHVMDDFRSIIVLLKMSSKRLFMDSFAQHAAAGLGMQSSVLWIANSPAQFGYAVHDNIMAKPFTAQPEIKNSFLHKFDLTGNPLQFPYKHETDMFHVEQVIESLLSQPI